jgi:signal transduction histidine kinase
LRADPQALEEFMAEALQGISLLHSVIKMPARSESAFRSKLNRIADEVESLAKQASTVRLSSINRCALALVHDIQAVLQQPACSGDDFLPLSVSLDELFVQINNTGRLAEQRAGRAISNERADATGNYRTLADWSADLAQRLRILVDRFGLQSQHSADLALTGLEQVPENQQRNVESILVQLVRNAIEHGIESASQRLANGKQAKGQISVDCTTQPGHGLQLDIRDDGCGFDLNLIRRLAIEQGLATSDELDNAGPEVIANLLVRPGFNSAGLVSDSGRGLGMEFLRELVLRIGGQISVNSQPGRQTHLCVSLPEQAADEALIETQRVA